MRVSVSRVVAALLLWPALATAQVKSLTEAEALARLSDDNPVVQAAKAGIAIARADIAAAGRWPNPRFTFNREAVAGVSENMFMVSQPLPISGRRGFAIDAATSRVAATTSRAEDRVRRLRADVRTAFAQLWSVQTRDRELQSQLEGLRRLSEALARREAAGDAAGFDRLRAEREVLEVETTRAALATDRAQATAILTSLLGVATDPIEAVLSSTSSTPVPNDDQLFAQAEETRGDLIAWRREVEAAQFAERAADRLWVPEPEVVAGTKSSNVGSGDIGSVVSVHLNVPIFDRGKPERAAAQARAFQATVEADALRRSIRAEIAAWRTAVIERRAVAERYRLAVSGAASQIERIAQVSYEAGERGILELLDAYRTAASARLRQVELDASARQAEIELEFVSGWTLP